MAEPKSCEYPHDCIHLQACRRVTKIVYNKTHRKVGRNCKDDCTAYEAYDDWYDTLYDDIAGDVIEQLARHGELDSEKVSWEQIEHGGTGMDIVLHPEWYC